MILYSYFRSSAAYRVRIALNLKNIEYTIQPIHLLKNGGQQHEEKYRAINPQCLVPALQTKHGILTQSLAIIEYLEECYPEPALLPDDCFQKAQIRSLAQIIGSDIHPLNNLRVLKHLQNLNSDSDSTAKWVQHWIEMGLNAFEEWLKSQHLSGAYCHANRPGLADLFLIPQIYNARRFECHIDNLQNINRIYENCMKLAAFQQAAPENQADAIA